MDNKSDISPTPETPMSPHQETSGLINKIRQIAPTSRLPAMLAWFPAADAQQSFESNPDMSAKAQFAARALGAALTWDTHINELQYFRPHESVDQAEDLDISQEDRPQIYSLGIALGQSLERYNADIIQRVMGGNFALVAEKISTVAEAVGFRTQYIDAKKGKFDAIVFQNAKGASDIIMPSFDILQQPITGVKQTEDGYTFTLG